MGKLRRCLDCDKPIREPKLNKSGYCSACISIKWRESHPNYSKEYYKKWAQRQKDDTQRQS